MLHMFAAIRRTVRAAVDHVHHLCVRAVIHPRIFLLSNRAMCHRLVDVRRWLGFTLLRGRLAISSSISSAGW